MHLDKHRANIRMIVEAGQAGAPGVATACCGAAVNVSDSLVLVPHAGRGGDAGVIAA